MLSFHSYIISKISMMKDAHKILLSCCPLEMQRRSILSINREFYIKDHSSDDEDESIIYFLILQLHKEGGLSLILLQHENTIIAFLKI